MDKQLRGNSRHIQGQGHRVSYDKHMKIKEMG